MKKHTGIDVSKVMVGIFIITLTAFLYTEFIYNTDDTAPKVTYEPQKSEEPKAPEVKKIYPDNGSYQAYSAQKFEQTKGQRKFILFFHADWCSTCQAWHEMIRENQHKMPPRSLILKANYDQETELKAELGVTYQSTAVFFDAAGNPIGTKSDPSMETILDFFAPEADQEVVKEIQVEAYQDFEALAFEAIQGAQKTMLFFHADWCPTCVAWEQKLEANLENLPPETVIFKVDYDNAQELKEAYDINKQSTAVFLDANGGVVSIEADPSIESVQTFFEAS